MSGSLFSLALKVPKGEALAFGVFGAVAFIGFVLSFGIRSPELEGGNGSESGDEEADSDGDQEEPER